MLRRDIVYRSQNRLSDDAQIHPLYASALLRLRPKLRTNIFMASDKFNAIKNLSVFFSLFSIMAAIEKGLRLLDLLPHLIILAWYVISS